MKNMNEIYPKDDFFKTISLNQTLKVGNIRFKLIIPDGNDKEISKTLGKPITRVSIYDDGIFKTYGGYKYFTTIEGTFNIYNSDSHDNYDVAKIIHGRYKIYTGIGCVIFVKIPYEKRKYYRKVIRIL